MGNKVKENEMIVSKSKKATDIDAPFITPENYDFIRINGIKTQSINGEDTVMYISQIDCPRVVRRIMDGSLGYYNMIFKFVKDSELGSVMIYVYDHGYYKLVTENEFKGYLKNIIPYEVRKVKDINEIYQLLLMENECYVDSDYLNSDIDYINFKNGLLNLNTMELESHSPDKVFTVQIPVDYKELEYCNNLGVFDKYLDELVSGDEGEKNILLEAMGLVLSNVPGYKTKKCILMVGPKDCGKTQIKSLLSRLIGLKYTSSIDLDKMNNNNFATSELYNKRLAGSNDMRYTTINDMGVFKQLTGGDAISLEFKGRGAFSYIFKGFIWFLANDFPIFSGKKGNEIYDRFLTISCKHIVKKEDQNPNLVDDMLKEKEYIVSLCIKHLLNLKKRNFKFVETDSTEASKSRYKIQNSSLLQFVTDCCIVSDFDLPTNERLKFTDFKKYYKYWCNNSNIKPLALKRQEVEEYLYGAYKTRIIKTIGVHSLTNIKMNEEVKEDYSMFGG